MRGGSRCGSGFGSGSGGAPRGSVARSQAADWRLLEQMKGTGPDICPLKKKETTVLSTSLSEGSENTGLKDC